jgi:hypothetical protein
MDIYISDVKQEGDSIQPALHPKCKYPWVSNGKGDSIQPVDIYTSDVKQVQSSSPLPLLIRGYLHFGCKAG